MKGLFESIKSRCPEVDDSFLLEHLERLAKRYFDCFSEEEICEHLQKLSHITPEHPVEVVVRRRRDGSVDCTILAFDYPSEFSMITGVLAGMGFSISSGDVFTYTYKQDEARLSIGLPKIGKMSRKEKAMFHRRRIVDRFSGTFESSLPFEKWAQELRDKMASVIGLLEEGTEQSLLRAKQEVNEMVVRRLERFQGHLEPVLYPVQIDIDNESGPFTRLKLVSEDTPAFLYSLSNALSVHNVSIEHVKIRTIRSRVEDEIDLVDEKGRRLEDLEVLNRVKFSTLLTKQFTYFLGKSPDPFTALSRFEFMVEELVTKPDSGQWTEMLSNPHTLRDLARLLGASDFLWEDFIRGQFETLLPLLQPYVKGHRFAPPADTLEERLNAALKGARSLKEQGERLNEFKDREIFLIDLDHILGEKSDFELLATRLTRLAEKVVNTASMLVYNDLVRKFGAPETVAGLRARYAIFGLGKLGSAALGYASDLELLFIYSDQGKTNGKKSIDNSEFFERLVRGVKRIIKAKREGIFHLDLRLRPYGKAGPLACSLENFCRYYAVGGGAHSYERLALVWLRAIGGDPELGARVERLRDEMIYFSGELNLDKLQHLREKQFREKTRAGRANAKFSPGGLVDIEYSIQILQVIYGKEVPALRTPLIHQALDALNLAGVLSKQETMQLSDAYHFFRSLINSMRMLRGSAKDLFLPPRESDELVHLARRMRYKSSHAVEPAEQLRIDYEKHSAAVRAFVERHFGRDSIPGSAQGSLADIVLSDHIPLDISHRILSKAGFMNPKRAYVNVKELAGDGTRRDAFAKLFLLAVDVLARKPDPDMALNNWERFIRALGSPEFHYNMLLSQPMRLEILLGIFAGSQFLSDTLIRNPGFLDWVVIPEVLNKIRNRNALEQELRSTASGSLTHRDWLRKIRRLRRREILRIGTRDICLGVSTREIMLELSRVAEAFVQVSLEKIIQKLTRESGTFQEQWEPGKDFCILAFGKLGGSELNYSSDIDLLGVWDDGIFSSDTTAVSRSRRKTFFARVMENLRSDLSSHTEEGYAYRVDLRLRPYGREGDLAPSFSQMINYYEQKASIWEIQAALKMRPVAGNQNLGYAFTQKIRPTLLKSRARAAIIESIEKMRRGAIEKTMKALGTTMDVKSGVGGLRDVEFLVQGLQLIHAPRKPFLLEPNTLTAIDLLNEAGILEEDCSDQLKQDYLFLRRVEHYLQILEDRQIHALPAEERELSALARRVGGIEWDHNLFRAKLGEALSRIRKAYETSLINTKHTEE